MQSIQFDSGVMITVTPTKILGTDNKGWNKSISNEDLGTFSYELYYHPTVTLFGWAIRIFLVGIPVAIWSTTFWLVLLGIALLLAIISFFEAMTESYFFSRILNDFIAKRTYIIKVGNKGGAEVEFHTLTTEEGKIKELELLVQKAKDNSSKKLTSSNLDEIRKLNELYKEGIITESEFNQQKKALLEI
jgi:hypothetical protein